MDRCQAATPTGQRRSTFYSGGVAGPQRVPLAVLFPSPGALLAAACSLGTQNASVPTNTQLTPSLVSHSATTANKTAITSIRRALFYVKLEKNIFTCCGVFRPHPAAPRDFPSFGEVQGPSPAVLCSACGQNTAWGLSQSGLLTPRPDQAHPGLGGHI